MFTPVIDAAMRAHSMPPVDCSLSVGGLDEMKGTADTWRTTLRQWVTSRIEGNRSFSQGLLLWGGTGRGKSATLRHLQQEFQSSTVFVKWDDFSVESSHNIDAYTSIFKELIERRQVIILLDDVDTILPVRLVQLVAIIRQYPRVSALMTCLDPWQSSMFVLHALCTIVEIPTSLPAVQALAIKATQLPAGVCLRLAHEAAGDWCRLWNLARQYRLFPTRATPVVLPLSNMQQHMELDDWCFLLSENMLDYVPTLDAAVEGLDLLSDIDMIPTALEQYSRWQIPHLDGLVGPPAYRPLTTLRHGSRQYHSKRFMIVGNRHYRQSVYLSMQVKIANKRQRLQDIVRHQLTCTASLEHGRDILRAVQYYTRRAFVDHMGSRRKKNIPHHLLDEHSQRVLTHYHLDADIYRFLFKFKLL
jgi:SpoVK/Ycf46/Vps4 family AAA+-type ATPase